MGNKKLIYSLGIIYLLTQYHCPRIKYIKKIRYASLLIILFLFLENKNMKLV